jgi:formylglycine-generating enzyme required for sulfatase activity
MERAARDDDGIPITPNAVNMGTPNSSLDEARMPQAVDDPQFVGGEPPDEFWHLLGNVEEWTRTYQCEADSPVVCTAQWDGVSSLDDYLYDFGGSWQTFVLDNSFLPAQADMPNVGYARIGFRCAY